MSITRETRIYHFYRSCSSPAVKHKHHNAMAIFIFIVNVTYSIVVAVQGAATESVAGWHRVRRRGGWGDPTVTQVSTWCRLSSLELFLFLTIEILTIFDNCGQFQHLIQLLLPF